MSGNNERIVVYPGTFDPITMGHLDIINRPLNCLIELLLPWQDTRAKLRFLPWRSGCR